MSSIGFGFQRNQSNLGTSEQIQEGFNIQAENEKGKENRRLTTDSAFSISASSSSHGGPASTDTAMNDTASVDEQLKRMKDEDAESFEVLLKRAFVSSRI